MLKYVGCNLSVVVRFGCMAMLLLMVLVNLWFSVRVCATVERKMMPPACSAFEPASARAARQRESMGDHAPAEKLVVALMLSAAS